MRRKFIIFKEVGEFMRKIEINEENYDMYQGFLDAKNGNMLENHVLLSSAGIIVASLAILSVAVTGAVLIMNPINAFLIVNVSEGIRKAIMMLGTSTISLGTAGVSIYKFCISGIPRILLKIFSHKHPNFDLSLSEEEVKKELEKYEQLSQIPKDIEEKKEEHLTNHQESFREMTTEEKLTFLEKEKEFWQQVAIQEKYRDTEEDTTGQTEIGQIKSPTENGEKVYHI